MHSFAHQAQLPVVPWAHWSLLGSCLAEAEGSAEGGTPAAELAGESEAAVEEAPEAASEGELERSAEAGFDDLAAGDPNAGAGEHEGASEAENELSSSDEPAE